jgi:hypothetical protein
MISTNDKPEISRKEKVKLLREFHQAELDKINPAAIFLPKMAYRPYGKTEKHIAFFESEINKGEDVYVEFCSREDVPEDVNRTLYKWRFNPHYEEEYEKTEPNPSTGHCRYLVPVEELTVIRDYGVKIEQPDISFDAPVLNGDDMDLTSATLRDLAAILLKKPVSNKKWLNDIITK